MIYAITAGFILLDLLTGLIKAFKEKAYTSTIMREGLFHKAGSVIVVCFGVLVDFAQQRMDLGISIPLAATICTYICLMEVGSIVENICIINPNFIPEKIKKYFSKLSDAKESEDEKK